MDTTSDLFILALDRDAAGKTERVYFAVSHNELTSGAKPRRITEVMEVEASGGGRIVVALSPTKTYAEGMGGGTSERSPEDRRLIRSLKSRFPGRVTCALIGQEGGGPKNPERSGDLVEFKPDMLKQAPEMLRACWTVPNRQDYMYLVTKTFGLNLVVRVIFMILPVRSGGMALTRAAVALFWYQLQDTVFTVFGQTYMRFLGRMTGMLRVGPAYLGDFTFVYFQLCFFEFLNRLVLGPLGMNPLVYTWHGMGLIFLNIIQGMVSGGPLIPAINKMRRAGVISHSTMMHFYQLSSLTMQFGLFASFGYQKFYFLLTTATLVLSWGSYALFSVFFLDEPGVSDPGLATRLDAAARLAH